MSQGNNVSKEYYTQILLEKKSNGTKIVVKGKRTYEYILRGMTN